jgi:hypothetical protein
MSTAPATAASPHEGTAARLRSLMIGALFALVLLIPKLLRVRRNAQSWMAIRIFLGFAGAALVILPLSLWNSWLAAIAGLGMFLAAILLPPAQAQTFPEEKASELGALFIVDGGKYQPGRAAPASVQLFVGEEHIWALDARLQTLLVIPAGEIISANAVQEALDRWSLQVRWSNRVAEFFYQGMFAQRRARAAQIALGSVMRVPRPVLPRSRAASA